MGSTPRTNHKPITFGSARRGGNITTHSAKQHLTNTSSVTLSTMQGREKCISARAHNGGKGWVEAAKNIQPVVSALTRDRKKFAFCVSLLGVRKNSNIPFSSIAKFENMCMHNPTARAWGGSRGDSKTLFVFSNDLVVYKL